jgi:TfoX/Sxy family transcriptional regulator of competence genes
MAYDTELADRLRAELSDQSGVTEKKMFGGLAFLLHGNMAVAASSQGGMMLRVDPADAAELTRHPHARAMEMRGRRMDGWLRVDAEAVESAAELSRWVAVGVAYAGSLPPK